MVSMSLTGKTSAIFRLTASLIGRATEMMVPVELKPNTGQLVLENNRLVFRGKAKKEGFVYFDVKKEEVRSFFLNVQPINLALVITGGIFITVGIALFFMLSWMIMYMFYLPIGLILTGSILLAVGLRRLVFFSVRVGPELVTALNIITKGLSQSNDFANFIEEFWGATKMLETQVPVALSIPASSPSQASAASLDFMAPAETPAPAKSSIRPSAPKVKIQPPSPDQVFICNTCYADFDSQESLIKHKEEENHW